MDAIELSRRAARYRDDVENLFRLWTRSTGGTLEDEREALNALDVGVVRLNATLAHLAELAGRPTS